MNHIRKSLAVILITGCFFAVGASGAADPATETFTKITTQGQLGGSFPFFSDETLDASTTVTTTHHKDTNTTYTTEGHLDGQGFADFGTLKNRLALDGPAGLSGIGTASFNDHWTISNPSLAGQTGIMTLAFDLSGYTTVLDTLAATILSDEYAGVGLIVDINPTSSNNGTRVLEYSLTLGSGPTDIAGVQGSPTVSAPIDFIYGQEFGVRVSLRTSAQSDNTYLGTTFSPYFEWYGGGTIDSITVDFASTAQLSAIVLPDDPLTSLSSSSTTDYSSLIMDSLPVPEPLSLSLLAIGSLAMLRGRRTQTH